MRPDAAPEPIICAVTGHCLGTFLPALGYWVTVENADTVRKVLADGRAYEDSPDNAPLRRFNLGASDAKVRAAVKVGA